MQEFKLVVLGSGGVGKSALTMRFVQGNFVDKYDPTIEDSYRKQMMIDSDECVLEILDTAGTEQFTAMRDLYRKNGQGFVLVYSITALSSFHEIKEIRESVLRDKHLSKVPMIIVGNKCDLRAERQVPTEMARELARQCDCAFMEASAKARVNVNEVFLELVRQVSEMKTNIDNEKPPTPVRRESQCVMH